MGFPENKKLAKDINKNTEKCSNQLETLLASINSQMGLMNSLISSISGGYVSKDYVDNAFNQAAQIKTGSYVGSHENYYDDSGAVSNLGYGNWNEINLGFRPQSVIIFDVYGRTAVSFESDSKIQCGGMFLSGLPLLDYKGAVVGEITDNGFRVRNGSPVQNNRNYCIINNNGETFYYQAFYTTSMASGSTSGSTSGSASGSTATI